MKKLLSLLTALVLAGGAVNAAAIQDCPEGTGRCHCSWTYPVSVEYPSGGSDSYDGCCKVGAEYCASIKTTMKLHVTIGTKIISIDFSYTTCGCTPYGA
jgi:hypothetical protein